MSEKNRSHHLEELEHKHWYDIADDEPHVRHWNIVDESGKKIGEVKDLLFDPEAKKARYLITNLKDGMLEEHRRVLVPLGRARLDREDRRIILPAVTLSQLARLPEYKGPERLTEEDELLIRDTFSGKEKSTGTEKYDRTSFYEHSDFEEDRYLRKK